MDTATLINDYVSWIKSETNVTQMNEYYQITTPFLDRFNDGLQIYIKQNDNGEISLTDDGYIIENLISSGITFRNNTNRKLKLDRILKCYSLTLDGNAITATATAKTFPQKKHMMVQAMLAVDDMFELNPSNVKDYFIDDVKQFFDNNNIYYSRDLSFVGKSGSLYTYDFHFQKTSDKPERFCKTINRLRRSIRESTMFNWIDTQEKREDTSELITIINDANKYNQEDIEAFSNYNIKTVFFSNIAENITMFNAS